MEISPEAFSSENAENLDQKRHRFREIGRRILNLIKKPQSSPPIASVPNPGSLSFEVLEKPAARSSTIHDESERVSVLYGALDSADEEELIKEMESYRRRKADEARSDRAQESIERRLNETLTTVDDFEEAFDAGDERVKKRTVEFEGKTVTIYELFDDFPFRALSTTINFKGPGSLGFDTAQRVLHDPSVWARTLAEARASGEYGEEHGTQAAGDTISLSYVNSGTNLDKRSMDGRDEMGQSCPPLVYGFSRIRPGSVLDIGDEDLVTANMSEGRTNVSGTQFNAIEELERSSLGGHNEIRIRRYDEAGRPFLPDYITTQDVYNITTGNADKNPEPINENNLRHAAYFNIPIVFIHRSTYRYNQ